VERVAPALDEFDRGVHVRVELGRGSTLESLAGVYHNKPAMWAYTLRVYTAVGLVHLGVSRRQLEPWQRALKINLTLVGAAEPGAIAVDFDFPLPHMTVERALRSSIDDLIREGGTRPDLHLIYAEKTPDGLRAFLDAEL